MDIYSPNLLAGLRRAHLAIEKTINRLLGVIRSYPSAKVILPELDDQVSAHFKRFDKAFFSELKVLYSQDRHSLKIIEFLEVDTRDITVNILTFFEKYSGFITTTSERNFPIDSRRFANQILLRLVHEKDYLLPLLADLAVDAS